MATLVFELTVSCYCLGPYSGKQSHFTWSNM